MLITTAHTTPIRNDLGALGSLRSTPLLALANFIFSLDSRLGLAKRFAIDPIADQGE